MKPSALVVESSVQQGVGWPLFSNPKMLENYEYVGSSLNLSVYVI